MTPTLSNTPTPFASTAARLRAVGYSPLPLIGKRPVEVGWQRRASVPLGIEDIANWATRSDFNIGVAMGYRGVVGIDIDTDDPEIRAALDAALLFKLPPGGVVGKRGLRGVTRFFRDPSGYMENRNFVGADGGMLVEILADGRQTVVPPSFHPATGRPYAWTTDSTLLNTAPEELPILSRQAIEGIERALIPWLKRPRPMQMNASTIDRHVVLDAVERARQLRYATVVLDREARLLAAMSRGAGRNRRAFDLACRLGRWVHNGIISESSVCCAILAACEHNGLAQEDGRPSVLASIRSGLARAVNDELPSLGSHGRGRDDNPR
jgi:hypothetical protein